MRSWVRRATAAAALVGAAALDLAARGAPARFSRLLAMLQGDGIASLAGFVTVGLVGVAVLVALSPAGRARGIHTFARDA